MIDANVVKVAIIVLTFFMQVTNHIWDKQCVNVKQVRPLTLDGFKLLMYKEISNS
jgi:hypothetical protein